MVNSGIIYVCDNLLDDSNSTVGQFLKKAYPSSIIFVDDISIVSQYVKEGFEGCIIFNMSIHSLESKKKWLEINTNGHCKIFISDTLNIDNMQDTILNKFDHIFINESDTDIVSAISKFVLDHNSKYNF